MILTLILESSSQNYFCFPFFSYRKSGIKFPKAKYLKLKENIQDVSMKLSTLAKILDPVRSLTRRDKTRVRLWFRGDTGFSSMVNATEKTFRSFEQTANELLIQDNSNKEGQVQKKGKLKEWWEGAKKFFNAVYPFVVIILSIIL